MRKPISLMHAIARLSVGLLSALSFIGSETAAAERPLDLSRALHADRPSTSLGGASEVIGRLIGTWAVDYLDISKDGKATRRTGQFIAAWVMDGRAIEDVWIVDPSGTRKEREVYADIRYFDKKSRSWPAVFIDPEAASIAKFTSETQGDSIILHSPDLGAGDVRWKFEDIRPTSFVFRDEASDDGGKTWRLRSEYHMSRKIPNVPEP